jgi:hypothetical protein
MRIHLESREGTCNRFVQFGTDFKIYTIIIVGTEGTKPEIGFLLDLGVLKSNQSMETIIFG